MSGIQIIAATRSEMLKEGRRGKCLPLDIAKYYGYGWIVPSQPKIEGYDNVGSGRRKMMKYL